MADTPPAILAFFHDVLAGREDEFEEWFQHEHLPERIAIPDFSWGDGTKPYRRTGAISIFMRSDQ